MSVCTAPAPIRSRRLARVGVVLLTLACVSAATIGNAFAGQTASGKTVGAKIVLSSKYCIYNYNTTEYDWHFAARLDPKINLDNTKEQIRGWILVYDQNGNLLLTTSTTHYKYGKFNRHSHLYKATGPQSGSQPRTIKATYTHLHWVPPAPPAKGYWLQDGFRTLNTTVCVS